MNDRFDKKNVVGQNTDNNLKKCGVVYIMNYYKQLLPIMVIPSSAIGFVTGIHSTTKNSSMEMFSNWVGYTSIGMIVGITYPVSFPLLAGYVVYKNR